jgi:hypothetical protein
MWIILEGADGSGKSTLARELHRQIHNSRLVHLGPPASPQTALEECLSGEDGAVTSYRSGSSRSRSLICDRLHWGSPTYGPIFRPESSVGGWGELGHSGWQYVEMVIAANGGVTVLIDVEAKVAANRIAVRGDDYVSVEHLVPIIDKYRDLVSESITLSSIFRMTQQSDTYNAARIIVERARLQSQHATRLLRFPGYVGAQYVDTLIMGPPTHDWRLKVLRDLQPGTWKNIGFVQRLSQEKICALQRELTRSGGAQTRVLNYRPTRVYSGGPWPIVHEHNTLMNALRGVK